MYKIYSGLLTGKNKREKVPVKSTRIEVASKGTGSSGPSIPNFNEFNDNEKFWKIDEVLHTLVKNMV